MRLIKILVNDLAEAEVINSLLKIGEEEGEIQFPFTVRFTEQLAPNQATRNLMREVD